MRILITGAGGLVGGCLAKYFSTENDVSALTHRDLDISVRESVFRRVEAEGPNVVFNCAVIGVDECERFPERAYSVNVAGSRNLAEAATSVNAAVVHFSTNYVFDGSRTEGFYTIRDEPLPINVYGTTKLEGERAVTATCERSFIVRTSWVFGPGKDNFYGGVHRRLRAGEAVEADDEIFASATYVNDLTGRVAEIVRTGRYGVYQVVNSGICSKYDFAVETARCLGMDEDEIRRQVVTNRETELGRMAPRPRYTPMKCLLSGDLGLPPMRDWQIALREYIETDSEL